MDAITNDSSGTGLAASQILQNTADSADENQQTASTQSDSTQSTEDDFSAFLLQSLGRSGQQQVNEEELFSSVIGEQLNELDPEAATYYQSQVQQFTTSMARGDGYVPVEDVAKAALKATVAAGKVSQDDAEMINAKAFASSQLDDNLDSLYDGRGDTSAVATMDEAMFKVQQVLDQVEAGTLTLSPRSLDIPSNVGTTPGTMLLQGLLGGDLERAGLDGAEESEEAESADETSEKQTRFTWKHEASDGNLAVLLPTRLNGSIAGVSLYDSDGNLIEEGDYSKRTGDNRAVFRFNHPGSYYGKDIDVAVSQDDGDVLIYNVKNGGERTYVPQDDYKEMSASAFAAAYGEDREDDDSSEVAANDDSSTPPTVTPSTPSDSSDSSHAADSADNDSSDSSSSQENSSGDNATA
jgi:hypothetical protein